MISEETRLKIVIGVCGHYRVSWLTDDQSSELLGIKPPVTATLIDTSDLDDPVANWVLMLYHSDIDAKYRGCRFELFGFDLLDQAVIAMVTQVNKQSLALMATFMLNLGCRQLESSEQQLEIERFEKSLAEELYLLKGQLKELGASSRSLFALKIPQRSRR